MKATLEYNLPEEEYNHLVAVHSIELIRCIEEIDSYLRNVQKHGIEQDLENVVDAVRSLCNDVMWKVRD